MDQLLATGTKYTPETIMDIHRVVTATSFPQGIPKLDVHFTLEAPISLSVKLKYFMRNWINWVEMLKSTKKYVSFVVLRLD